MLREAIRDNKALEWDSSDHPNYLEFKRLAPQVAAIIIGERLLNNELMRKITSNIYESDSKLDGRGR